jgi:hypothetical protein
MAAAAPTVGGSIVDHAIGTRPLLQYAASATTIDQDDVDVQLCGSDHTSITLLLTTQIRKVSPVRSMRWRLSRLTSADRLQSYSNALGNLTRLRRCHESTETATPQALVTQVELALQRVIHTAAVKTIGQKCVRRGATKAWMTTALRRLLDSRRAPTAAHGYANPQKEMMRSDSCINAKREPHRLTVRTRRSEL